MRAKKGRCSRTGWDRAHGRYFTVVGAIEEVSPSVDVLGLDLVWSHPDIENHAWTNSPALSDYSAVIADPRGAYEIARRELPEQQITQLIKLRNKQLVQLWKSGGLLVILDSPISRICLHDAFCEYADVTTHDWFLGPILGHERPRFVFDDYGFGHAVDFSNVNSGLKSYLHENIEWRAVSPWQEPAKVVAWARNTEYPVAVDWPMPPGALWILPHPLDEKATCISRSYKRLLQ